MKHITSSIKWILIGIGAISLMVFLVEPSHNFIESIKAGYIQTSAENKRIEEQKKWITASEIQYPAEYELFNNLDIIQLVKRIKKEDPTTYNYLFGSSKIPLEEGVIRKLHPDAGLLYDTCQKTINSNEWLTELYTYLVADEILGLNSKMTNLTGLIDSYAEKVGRDYIYFIGDTQIKYLMEGINERGAEILRDNLRAPEHKIQEYKIYMPTESDFDIAKKLTKPMGHQIIIQMCIAADMKLGLMGLGTNFQTRAQQAADMVQRKIKIEKTEEYEKRRDKLNKTLDDLKNTY